MKLTRGQSLVALGLLGAGIDALVRRPARTPASETLTFSPDGRWIARSNAGGLSLYDAETRETRWSVVWPGGVIALAFSADSSTLAALRSDNQVTIRDVASGVRLQSFPVAEPDQKLPGVLALSPNGDRLAVADLDGTIALFQAREGRWLQNFTKGESSEYITPGVSRKYNISSMAFTHSGNELISIFLGKEWIIATIFGEKPNQFVTIRDIETQSEKIVLSQNGECVAYVQKEGNRQYLSLDSSRTAKTIYERYLPSLNTKLMFTADSSLLVVLEDEEMTIYNTANGMEINDLCANIATGVMTVSPNGKKLAYLEAGQLVVMGF